MNNRRINDQEFNEIKELIIEIHQRQIEQTLPQLKKIEECLYGNGKCGLIAEHEVVKIKLNDLINLKTWVKGLIVTIIASLITFSFWYGYLYRTVDYIKDMITKTQ